MASARRFKTAVYQQLARLTKALANPSRLELLELLIQSPRTVERLAQLARISVANTSQHLQVLRAAGLVEPTRRGLYRVYRLSDPAVADLVRLLRSLAESRLEELRRLVAGFFQEPGISLATDGRELLRRVRRGEVVLIDVRPPEEYAAGHLPGAISVPLEELDRRLGELPRRGEIVAYCRGPYCVLAAEAVRRLRRLGWKATRLRDGVDEWRARGFGPAVSRAG